MNYWIIRDEKTSGPFSVDDLRQMEISADTPVWYQGLSGWTPAGAIAGLESLFAVSVAAQPFAPATGVSSQSVAAGNGSAECPPNYLVASIVMTILFFLPAGVVAIIFATKVKPLYRRGDVMKARKMSERAALWTILSLVIGLILIPFKLVFEMI